MYQKKALLSRYKMRSFFIIAILSIFSLSRTPLNIYAAEKLESKEALAKIDNIIEGIGYQKKHELSHVKKITDDNIDEIKYAAHEESKKIQAQMKHFEKISRSVDFVSEKVETFSLKKLFARSRQKLSGWWMGVKGNWGSLFKSDKKIVTQEKKVIRPKQMIDPGPRKGLKDLELTGIVHTAEGSRAIIGGELYQEGDSIYQTNVDEITDKQVILADDNQEITIRMK